MNEKLYGLAECFTSIQGEGGRMGTLNHFIRFAACNLDCKAATGYGFDCDTDFKLKMRMTVQQIIDWCRKSNPNCNWCILTGGEPALQVDLAFIDAMNGAGFYLAIETNGTVQLPKVRGCTCVDGQEDVNSYALNWITVSPKKSPLPIKQLVASEVKYVLAAGDPLPLSPVLTDRHFISPAFCGSNLDPAAVEWCIKVIHDNPTWRLSLQTHKWINVR